VAKKRKVRRVQYFPEAVVAKVLSNDFLRTLVYVVYTAKLPQSAGAIAKEVSKILGSSYSHAYVSTYLRRLERWGAVRAYRDPTNGHLLWWVADTRTAEIIRSELERGEVRKLMEYVGGVSNATEYSDEWR